MWELPISSPLRIYCACIDCWHAQYEYFLLLLLANKCIKNRPFRQLGRLACSPRLRSLVALSLLGCVTNRPLRGVNFYAYSVSGGDLLSVIRCSGCPFWRGYHYMDFYSKTIEPQKFVRYIAMSLIKGCPLSGVSLYTRNAHAHVIILYSTHAHPTVIANCGSYRDQQYS